MANISVVSSKSDGPVGVFSAIILENEVCLVGGDAPNDGGNDSEKGKSELCESIFHRTPFLHCQQEGLFKVQIFAPYPDFLLLFANHSILPVSHACCSTGCCCRCEGMLACFTVAAAVAAWCNSNRFAHWGRSRSD